MKRSSDRIIKSRHKGLSRKDFNRGGVGILQGRLGSSRTRLDRSEGKGKDAGGSFAPCAGRSPPHPVGLEHCLHRDMTHLMSHVIRLNYF